MEDSDQFAVDHRHAKLSKANKTLLDFALASFTSVLKRRLGEFFKRPTQKFNGYGSQLAELYNGMDLRKDF